MFVYTMYTSHSVTHLSWFFMQVYSGLAKLLTECWHSNGAARLTALRIRRRLEDILHKCADKSENLEGNTKPS